MPFDAYIDTYDGKVVDNKDPQKNGRIKVSCPEIFGDVTISDWIPSSENHSGQLFVPEIGDLVSITCKNGDPNQMRYGTTKHKDGQTPLSAKNEIDFSNTGNSSFKTCGDFEVVEPQAPKRSDYPKIKTLMENKNSFIEMDDSGRFLLYNKKTNHFIEFHENGDLVIKAKRIFIESSDEENGISIKSFGRLDISVIKDFTLSVFQDLHLWIKQEFLQTIKENVSIIASKLFMIGSGKGLDLDSSDRVNISSKDKITILAEKVDIVNEDDI